MALSIKELIAAASQGLGGGNAGAAQLGYGVKTNLENLQSKIANEAKVLGAFVGRTGGSGFLQAAAQGGQKASAQQEVQLLQSQVASLSPMDYVFILGLIAGGYFLWRKMRR